MDAIKYFIDFILHLDVHLTQLVKEYGPWVYLVLFVIVFCETGLVVTPFLPGDSLLFTVGALCALELEGALDFTISAAVLLVAAFLGDTVNYWIGNWIGPKVFKREKSRWFNPRHLERAHEFSVKYGAKAIVLARFVPIIRTFAPFVAGVGRMPYFRFLVYNLVGAVAWVMICMVAGYYFGNIPTVKKNFSVVIFAIIGISIIPVVVEYVRHRRTTAAEAKRADGL